VGAPGCVASLSPVRVVGVGSRFGARRGVHLRLAVEFIWL